MVLGTLRVSLLGKMLAGKKKRKQCYKDKEEEQGRLKEGTEEGQTFYATSSFEYFWDTWILSKWTSF